MFFAKRNSIGSLFTKKYYQQIVRCCTETAPKTGATQTSNITPLMSFGQPTPLSHPHLLRDGELLPGIEKQEFKIRRDKLINLLKKKSFANFADSSQIVIIPSATKVYMTNKIPYVFRQNSDFLYFSGCQEPDSVLVLITKGDDYSTTLFMRPKEAHGELWDGPRTGVEGVSQLFEIENAISINDLSQFMMSYLSENTNCTVWYDNLDVVQPNVHKKLEQILKYSSVKSVNCPKFAIHQVRLIKSQSEINLMQKSCEIASDAISRTISLSKPGISEHELFATVDYECRMRGAEFLAYPPVVAGGKNANTIHYITNNQVVKDKEMVLMDAGCEYHGYSSDITRTWPVNGKFTPEQRILYEIVLEIQKILIIKCGEMPSLDMVYHEMCLLLGKRLQQEHILSKSLSGSELLDQVCALCPHHVSHYLGMDIHDTGKISRSIKIQPGMIVTVEPGIYVTPNNKWVPPEFHNLGIRIEDDILVQESGPMILSKNCPKEVVDIEALVGQSQL